MNPLIGLAVIGCSLFARLLTAIFTSALTGLICWIGVASLAGDGESAARIGIFSGLAVGFLIPAAIVVPLSIVACTGPGLMLGILLTFLADGNVEFWMPAGAIAGASVGAVAGIVILVVGCLLTDDEDAAPPDLQRPGDIHRGQLTQGTDDGDTT